MSGRVNRNLLEGEAIFCALARGQQNDSFIKEGRNAIRRAPDDRIGASLAFHVNHFATGYWGSFSRKKF